MSVTLRDNMKKTLVNINHEQKAEIIAIEGGKVFEARLNSMGIRIGKSVKKISSHFLKGPQTVEIGNTRIAIGYNMAKKILVEIKHEHNKR